MKKIAIIPARAGSKGIKEKNLKEIGGISLVGRAVLNAVNSECFDEVIISSDGDEILLEGEKYGAIPMKRPERLSLDNVKTIEVIKHILKEKGITEGVVTLLQPTSPLRNYIDVKNAMILYDTGKFNSVVSACECDHHPYKSFILEEGNIEPIRSISDFEAPRQSLDKAYRLNGAIYINDVKSLLEENSFFAEPQSIYIMPKERSIDIDNIVDLEIAKLYYDKIEIKKEK